MITEFSGVNYQSGLVINCVDLGFLAFLSLSLSGLWNALHNSCCIVNNQEARNVGWFVGADVYGSEGLP